MQLFIVSHLERKGNQLFLPNVPDLLAQLRKVLRAKVGDTIFIQPEKLEPNGNLTRYELKISDRTDKTLTWEIVSEQPYLEGSPDQRQVLSGGQGSYWVGIFVAMPNKREKAELITQKLSEIGIDEILFRPAERSVISQWNEKKSDRLQKIAREAVEQSRGRRIPHIARCENVREYVEGKEVVIFDKTPFHKGGRSVATGDLTEQWLPTKSPLPPFTKGGILGVVGPEGWLTTRDYQLFESFQVVSLGQTILRMETAAIIGGWMLKNF